MTKSISDQLKDIEISLLQLQRSALIDTQTIMQILIDKGICDIEDIVITRSKIESESEDVLRVTAEIESSGGSVSITPVPESAAAKEELKKELSILLQQLKEST